MRLLRYGVSTLLLCLTIGHTVAQTIDCPVLENAALSEARGWCNAMNSGQACYGNAPVESRILEPNMPFQQPGQIARLSAMKNITTHALPNQYGVTISQIQPYPADSWESTTATMITFGETALINQGHEYEDLNLLSLAVTEVGVANVRSGPSKDASSIGAVRKDQTIKATGRVADNSWLRIQMPEGRTGWVSSTLFTTDFNGLAVVTAEDAAPAPYYRPFTAFTLSTRLDDARCTDASPSGVLIQTGRADPATPDQRYKLFVNGVQIALEGTVFLQGAPSQELRISVVEGSATVGAMDESVDAIEGERVIVRLGPLNNDTIEPTSAPLAPADYDYTTLLPLPMRLLPRVSYVGFDVRSAFIRPRPENSESPLGRVLVADPCQVSVAADGVNVRAGAGREFPIRAVLNFRESATPIARALGTDGVVWWQLSQDVWVSGETVVTGGDCAAVPLIDAPRPRLP